MSIKSPCRSGTGIISCTLSMGGVLCQGCFRDVEEVRDWNGYDEEAKEAVLINIIDRKIKIKERRANSDK